MQLSNTWQGTVGYHQHIKRVGIRAYICHQLPDTNRPPQPPLFHHDEVPEWTTDEMGRHIELLQLHIALSPWKVSQTIRCTILKRTGCFCTGRWMIETVWTTTIWSHNPKGRTGQEKPKKCCKTTSWASSNSSIPSYTSTDSDRGWRNNLPKSTQSNIRWTVEYEPWRTLDTDRTTWWKVYSYIRSC